MFLFLLALVNYIIWLCFVFWFLAFDDAHKSHRSRHRMHRSSNRTLRRSPSSDSQHRESVSTAKVSSVRKGLTHFSFFSIRIKGRSNFYLIYKCHLHFRSTSANSRWLHYGDMLCILILWVSKKEPGLQFMITLLVLCVNRINPTVGGYDS